MMGSGKSTIGRLLSARCDWPYFDNDDLVRQAAGATAREVLEDRGVDGLRDVEAAALAAGIEIPPPAIIAAAAGTILDPDLRSRLPDAGLVVWLRAAPGTLAERARAGDHRPFVDRDEAAAWMTSATLERDPLYAEVAELVVDTDLMTADQAVDRIVERLATP
jgi:shikimate kinase